MPAGGASGIGENCVREFAWEGASVAIIDTDPIKGRRLELEINSVNPKRAVFYQTDVSESKALTSAIDDFANRNDGRITTLVNNGWCLAISFTPDAGLNSLRAVPSPRPSLPSFALCSRVFRFKRIGRYSGRFQ